MLVFMLEEAALEKHQTELKTSFISPKERKEGKFSRALDHSFIKAVIVFMLDSPTARPVSYSTNKEKKRSCKPHLEATAQPGSPNLS